jgi:signal transduction histidine kinase
MFNGAFKNLRTNLLVLGMSSASTLVGILLVSYGGAQVLVEPDLANEWYWSALVISLAISGVVMFIAKGIVHPRWIRYVLGAISFIPVLLGILSSIAYGALPFVALTMPGLVCLALALYIDEPQIEATTRSLIRFFSSTVLILLAPLSLILPKHEPLPVGGLMLWLMFCLGIVGALLHALRPRGQADRIAGMMTGAVFLAFGVSCLGILNPVTAIAYLPIGAILLFEPLFKNYRLGCSDSIEGLTEENKVVLEVEKPMELVAWSIFIFAYLHAYAQDLPNGINDAHFTIFTIFFVCYAIIFKLFPPSHATYRNQFVKSVTYIILLSLLCHITGGLTSPFVWFFLLTIQGIAATPQPRNVFGLLSLILIYYSFEIDYTVTLGQLNDSIILNNIARPLFIIGLTASYGYFLSVRRLKVDTQLESANASYREALRREGLSKEMAVKQASDISLVRKRDEALLNSLADGVIAIDTDGLINLVNPVAQRMFNLPIEDIIGKRIRDQIMLKRENDPAFRIGSFVDIGLQGKAVPLPEGLYLEKAEGRKVFYSGMVLPVLEDSKRPSGAVVVMQDISFARDVDQLKTNFISVAAHQLRTPLSTIRWYLELLNDPSEGKMNKDQKNYVENAYTSVLRMVGLVNSLLSITRLENARVPIRPEPIDLKEMTQSILAIEERKLKEREITATLMPGEPLEKIMLDPTLSREVFLNLIENAIRYTRKGGNIFISIKDSDSEVIWSIKDEGIGIPKDQQDRIFEKFYRATNAVEFNTEGSGLGLYLAHFIVENWGGRLTFESREGYGTTFNVTVPKQGMKSREGQVFIDA